jgi:hypothetical protein
MTHDNLLLNLTQREVEVIRMALTQCKRIPISATISLA